ncbi:MAG: RNA polymerase sigma factor RpoD/SigA [Patescibacteria group bacterium]
MGDESLDYYLKQIGATPLIDRDEETRLARRIHRGDKIALDKLTQANLRFVVSVAKQYQNQGLSLGDLINEGNIGLIKAAKRFDETRGFKFISYAVWWIRQAILQALAENSRIVRLPLNRVGTLHKIGKASARLEQVLSRQATPEEIAEELELSESEVATTLSIASTHLSLDSPFEQGEDNSLMDVLEDPAIPRPYMNSISESLRLEIEAVLDTLTSREAEIIDLYFGISRQPALTLEQIGAQFSRTRERIRQIKEKAIRKLRHASRSRTLRSYWAKMD